MSWTVDLTRLEAVHTNGLHIRFTWNDGGWDGKPVAGRETLTSENAARLMREAGEAFYEALRGSALKHRCLRCGHGWNPRLKGHPLICPTCKTPYWDRARR